MPPLRDSAVGSFGTVVDGSVIRTRVHSEDTMKLMLTKRAAPAWAVAMLILALLFPIQSLAQGRGHGQDKKAAKFINGHDARDGRWDGRGPKPTVIRHRRAAHHASATGRHSLRYRHSRGMHKMRRH